MADITATSGQDDQGKMEDGDGLDVDSVTAAVATGSDMGDNGNDDNFSMEVRGSEFVDVPAGSIGSNVTGGGGSGGGNVGSSGNRLGVGMGVDGGGMCALMDEVITSQETSPSSAV